MTPVRLHVVCGGGTGGPLLRRLAAEGYRLSVGPLSVRDDDTRTAIELGADLATVDSDGTSEADALDRARTLLARADGVILTSFAVGRGNLSSLSLPLELPDDVPLFLVSATDFSRRDYTGGEATRLYRLLEARVRARPRSLYELLPILAAHLPSDRPTRDP